MATADETLEVEVRLIDHITEMANKVNADMVMAFAKGSNKLKDVSHSTVDMYRDMFDNIEKAEKDAFNSMTKDMGKLSYKYREEALKMQKDNDNIVQSFSFIPKSISNVFNSIVNLKNAFLGFAAVQGFKSIITDTVNLADNIGDLSVKFNLSTKFIQELDYVAKTTGTSFEELATSITRMTKNAYEADSGNKAMSQAFKDINVNVKDANDNFKTSEQLLPEVLEGLKGLGAGTQQTAMAVELFGRSGANMIPIINMGGEAFEKMKKTLSENGGIISSENIKAAEEYKDTMTKFNTVMNTIKLDFIAPLIKNITSAMQTFVANKGAEKVAKGFDILIASAKIFFTVFAVARLQAMIGSWQLFAPVITRVAVSMGTVEVTSSRASIAVSRLGVAMKGLALNPLLLAVTGLTTAFVLLDQAQKKATREGMSEFNKLSIEQQQSAIVLKEKIDALTSANTNNIKVMSYTTAGMGGMTEEQKKQAEQVTKNKEYIEQLSKAYKEITGHTYEWAVAHGLSNDTMKKSLELAQEQVKATEGKKGNGKKTLSEEELKAIKEANEKIAQEKKTFSEHISQMENEILSKSFEGRNQIIEDQRIKEANDALLLYEKKTIDAQTLNDALSTIETSAQIKSLENQIAYNEEMQKIEEDKKKRAEEQSALAKKAVDEEKALNKQRIESYMNVASGMISNASKIAGAFKSQVALQKALATAEVGMNTARAVMQIWADPLLPFFLKVPATGLAIGAGIAQVAQISQQKFATGGFPRGRNANIMVNENGQESILNARATSNLGYGGVNALNSGQNVSNKSTNEITYAPTINITGGNVSTDMVLGALRKDKQGFAEFFNRDVVGRGYLPAMA